MVRSILSIVLSYCLLLCTWPTLSFARDGENRRRAERTEHESSVGSESGLPLGGKQGNPTPKIGLPGIKGMSNNDPRTIQVDASKDTVTNSTIQTERYLSSLLVIVTMAIVGSSSLYCNKIFDAPAWDITDYYLAIGAAIAAIFAEIYTFGMYQGMTYSNFKIGSSDDDRKLTDEQRDALIQERQMLEATKGIAEMRSLLFGAAAAMFLAAAAIAGTKAFIHYAGILGCATSAEVISDVNLTACEAMVSACSSSGAATLGVGTAACQAGTPTCATCKAALTDPTGKDTWKNIAADLVNTTFTSDIYSAQISAKMQQWLAKADPACVTTPPQAAAFNAPAAAYIKTCQLVKEAIAINLITCQKPPVSSYTPLHQEHSPSTPFVANAHAQIPGMDLMDMVSKALIPKNKDATGNKLAKGGGLAGGLALGGLLAGTAGLIKMWQPQIWRIVDTVMGHSVIRFLLYSLLAAMLAGLASYNFTVVRPNMDKEIQKIDAIIARFDTMERFKNGTVGNKVVAIPFTQPVTLEFEEALKSNQPANLPCPAGGDGKGNCIQIKNDQEFLLQGPDFLSQSKTSSQDATRLTNSLVSKNAAGKQGLQDAQSLSGALKKLKSENALLRKKLQEKLTALGSPNNLLDTLEDKLSSRFSSLVKNAGGGNVALGSFKDLDGAGPISPNDLKNEKDTNSANLNVKKASDGEGSKPDWDVKYDYSEPSQEQELAALASGEGYQAAGAQSDVSEYKEENIFNQITLRYFKTAYPIIFKEVK